MLEMSQTQHLQKLFSISHVDFHKGGVKLKVCMGKSAVSSATGMLLSFSSTSSFLLFFFFFFFFSFSIFRFSIFHVDFHKGGLKLKVCMGEIGVRLAYTWWFSDTLDRWA